MSGYDQKSNPKKLFIGSLPFDTTDDQLRQAFSPHGEIVELKLISDRFTGQSKGIAFIEYATEQEAKAAIDAMHESQMGTRNIVVSVAKPPRPRENFSYDNNKPRRGNRF